MQRTANVSGSSTAASLQYILLKDKRNTIIIQSRHRHALGDSNAVVFAIYTVKCASGY
jgi:hypothetical protein